MSEPYKHIPGGDYSRHLTAVESLIKAIKEKAPLKDKEVMYLAERAISHLWEIRDLAELGYPLPESITPDVMPPLPRATFRGQWD